VSGAGSLESTDRLTVLVLGVGGNVSQGILKSLERSSLRCRVIAGCISPLSLGLYRADLSLITPRADEEAFSAWLEDVCRAEGVDAILSGAEPVLDALAPLATRLRQDTGAVSVVSPPELLEVGRDKLLTARWLDRNGLRSPRSADAADGAAVERLLDECGFPLVAKPRRGKGAQGVMPVASSTELALVEGQAGYVLQEHLEGEEFTVGCFCDSDGELRGALAMRRELTEGTTSKAEVGEFPPVRDEAMAIAHALRPLGPLNVQLRESSRGPVAFELNVRFSGTTPVRARLGFNEVEAALRHFVLGEPVELPRVTRGTVLRYWNELYVSPEAHEALLSSGRLDDPWSFDTEVEDWGMGR
jgi:carbamoyl-phosphate synthase large subunit